MAIQNIPVSSQQALYSASGIDASQAPKAFSEVYPKSEFTAVDPNIHMVWVGSRPREKQQEYLRQWAEKNPGSEIRLWVDSTQFDAFTTNQAVREEAKKVCPVYPFEKPLRGLFSQLKITLGNPGAVLNFAAQKQALSELNKELSTNEFWKEKVLPTLVTVQNAEPVLATFQRVFPEYQSEETLPSLFRKLETTLDDQKKTLSDLNEKLSSAANESWKEKVLPTKVTAQGAEEALTAFQRVFPDYQSKEPLPSLFRELETTLGTTHYGQEKILSKLNEELSSQANEFWKEKVLPTQVTVHNAGPALAAFQRVFPEYQSEEPLPSLFKKLEAALGGREKILSELNEKLSSAANESWKVKVLPSKVTAQNGRQTMAMFAHHTGAHEERFFQAERMILDQTVKSWDRCVSNPPRDVATLRALQEQFRDIKNVEICDLSNPSDIQLKNKDAYQHEIIGRNGAYPAASDIARYEILHVHGGVYADIDLECMQPLSGALQAHPNLMLVGLAEGKNEASGSATPYFANALLASHPGSKMLSDFIDKIGEDYQTLKGNEFGGDRYFSRPNKYTIEATGPNGLRGHVDTVIRQAQEQPESMRNDVLSLSERIWDQSQPKNKDFWSSMESHFKFPDNLVNFETEEQENSATKTMGGVVPLTAASGHDGATFKVLLQTTGGVVAANAGVRSNEVVTTERVAALILEKIQEKRQPDKPMIIFIAGPSASGKSALTKALEKAELKFESVKTDHFLKSFSELSKNPANRGSVEEWSVVHGHADSFDSELAARVLQELSSGKGSSYNLPSNYREGVMIGGYPRGERDPNGPHKEIKVPAGDTYLIEGISTPHLVKDASHVLVRLDCEFEETVDRRAKRKLDEAIPEDVKYLEDKGQYDAFEQAMGRLEIVPDLHLSSTRMTPGRFLLF
ncbi:uridine kinase [Pseudomonas frederiksbergensis]|uniref:TcdA/TcdB catalytic glycosyltransferase domain-containing protein n=1 Tax=Pseudomonas frederiksbergensis TaxID=104087 RepID=UPI003D1A8D90